MQVRRLGDSGLQVSALCLGAMTLGEADENSMMYKLSADERTSFAILDRAVDAGINFIDTADVYGQDGLSERVLGRWFAAHGRRDEVVLATKFRFRMAPGPNGTGASRRRIVRCVEDSLRRLQTDRIDLYQIHMQDLDTPEEEILRALDDLVRAGKVLYIGASNYAAYRLVDSLWTSRHQKLERFVSLQMQYSLVQRALEREHVPLCRQWGVGIIPWAPLAGGFLTGKYRQGQRPPEGARLDRQRQRYDAMDHPRTWRIVDTLIEVAGELGATPAQVALAWLLHQPAVTSVIFGARTLEQLEDNLPAGDLVIPPELLARLDEASQVSWGYPYDMLQRIQGRW